MLIICLDLEGVLVPEIWINVAEKTGISDLRVTTRDISDYDELMIFRLKVLEREGIFYQDILNIIALIDPLEGAGNFLDKVRRQWQVIILSDTFIQFAKPLMNKLNWPTLFCNSLKINDAGYICEYHLRQKDGKKVAVEMFKNMGFSIYAAGDSHNDLSMLQVADGSTLFRAPESISEKYPEIHQTNSYNDLLASIKHFDEAFHLTSDFSALHNTQ